MAILLLILVVLNESNLAFIFLMHSVWFHMNFIASLLTFVVVVLHIFFKNIVSGGALVTPRCFVEQVGVVTFYGSQWFFLYVFLAFSVRVRLRWRLIHTLDNWCHLLACFSAILMCSFVLTSFIWRLLRDSPRNQRLLTIDSCFSRSFSLPRLVTFGSDTILHNVCCVSISALIWRDCRCLEKCLQFFAFCFLTISCFVHILMALADNYTMAKRAVRTVPFKHRA